MISLRKLLFGNNNNIVRKSVLWNMIASVINGLEAVIILAVATRTIGIEKTGIYTISFTIANLAMCIGKYGVRNYQVTDVKDEYSFREYLHSRYISLGIMAISCLLYCGINIFIHNYGMEKAGIVLLICGLYGLEAFEDVYLAGLQHNGRLDVGAKMFSVRWTIVLTVWTVMLFVTHNAILSVLVAFIIGLLSLIILVLSVRKEADNTNSSFDVRKIGNLFRECLPLCIVAVLAIFLPNAGRYVIDLRLNDEMQAYFGYIAMPIFVIDLLCFVIFQPLMVKLSELWTEKKTKEFILMGFKMFIAVLCISVVAIIAAYFIGIPVLSLLYSVNLTEYKPPFMILMIGGIYLAYIGLYSSLLTVMRKQNRLMVCYLIISIIISIAFFIMPEVDFESVCMVNTLSIGLLSVSLLFCVLFEFVKRERLADS